MYYYALHVEQSLKMVLGSWNGFRTLVAHLLAEIRYHQYAIAQSSPLIMCFFHFHFKVQVIHYKVWDHLATLSRCPRCLAWMMTTIPSFLHVYPLTEENKVTLRTSPFTVAVSHLWNTLPLEVHLPFSLAAFCQDLNMHSFGFRDCSVLEFVHAEMIIFCWQCSYKVVALVLLVFTVWFKCLN